MPQPGKSTQADPRFQPVIEHYRTQTKSIGITPAFNASDAKQLKRFLNENPSMAVARIFAIMDNAFSSTDQYPLRRGFRLREFLAHQAKYQLGPLMKNGRRPEPVAPR